MDAESVGRLLFGRGLRLRLAIWVSHTTRVFYAQQAADALGVRSQYLRAELDRLLDLRMIRETDYLDIDNIRNFYEKTKSPLWDVIRAAERIVDDPPERQP